MSEEPKLPPMYRMFEHAWSRADKVVDYDERWVAGLGRRPGVNPGTYMPTVAIGRTYAARDSSGLKYLMIGTRFGNVLVYEPSHGNEIDPIYKVWIPQGLEQLQWYNGSQLNDDTMRMTVGSDTTVNVGVKLETLLPPVESNGN